MTDLHPELKEQIKQEEHFQMIRHPLVHVIYSGGIEYANGDHEHEYLNKMFEHKTRSLGNALRDQDFDAAIFLHERPYRPSAFFVIGDMIPGNYEWNALLRRIWIDTEYPSRDEVLWKNLFESHRFNQEHFMGNEDYYTFRQFPDVFEIYRGGDVEEGFSWTVSREIAEWFGRRFSKSGTVHKCTIRKQDVTAYTNARDEQEIIIL